VVVFSAGVLADMARGGEKVTKRKRDRSHVFRAVAEDFIAAKSSKPLAPPDPPLPLARTRHAAVEIRRVEQVIVLDDGARNPM
jgi:hypothetical protein